VSGGFGSKEYFWFDVKSGKKLWAIDLSDDSPSTTDYSDGIIYFNTESCTIFAVNYLTGEQRWSFWLGDPLLTSPNILGSTVFTSYPVWLGIDSTKERSQKITPSHPFIGSGCTKGNNVPLFVLLQVSLLSQAVVMDMLQMLRIWSYLKICYMKALQSSVLATRN